MRECTVSDQGVANIAIANNLSAQETLDILRRGEMFCSRTGQSGNFESWMNYEKHLAFQQTNSTIKRSLNEK